MIANSDRKPLAGRYTGQTVAFLTQHGKERLVQPLFQEGLGCFVRRIDGYDTDTLGTFTGEIPRDGTQLAAARKKARLSVEMSGLRLGLGSEGAFGPDPHIGVVPWNLEVLTFLDLELGIEVTSFAQGPAIASSATVSSWEELLTFIHKAGFPDYQMVLRPGGSPAKLVTKGVADTKELARAFAQCREASPDGTVFVESDLRAHANPKRQERIREAAVQLCRRLHSLCPSCGSPGFWVSERLSGLPCEDCGTPTEMTRGEVWSCVRCSERGERMLHDLPFASSSVCSSCNP